MKTKLNLESWNGFLELCLQMHTPEQLAKLFDLFLTLEEKETLSLRYSTIKTLLEEELTQREISEKFKVSIAQITRGSNALKIISTDLEKALRAKLKKSK